MKPELFWLRADRDHDSPVLDSLYLEPRHPQRHSGRLPHAAHGRGPDRGEWAQRAKRAHTNAVENLVVFAALVVTAQLAGISNPVTAFASALYFWARLGHFVALTLGIPYVRTVIWSVSSVAGMITAWQVLVR